MQFIDNKYYYVIIMIIIAIVVKFLYIRIIQTTEDFYMNN
jgi:hypothetical protein